MDYGESEDDDDDEQSLDNAMGNLSLITPKTPQQLSQQYAIQAMKPSTSSIAAVAATADALTQSKVNKSQSKNLKYINIK